MEISLWRGDPWAVAAPMLAVIAVLLLFPTAWAHATDRQIVIALSPLIVLCALSVVTYLLNQEYLFPWYNLWGLIAVAVTAAAACLTSLPQKLRIGLVALGVLSVMLSTSRQALLAIFLLASVWLFQADELGTRVRRLAAGIIVIGLLYSAIGASARVEEAGGASNSDGRYALFASGWSVISRSPISGLGESTSNSDLKAALKTVGLGRDDSVHNFVLDSWLRGGVLAAVIAVMFILSVIWPRRRRGRFTGLFLLPFFLLGDQLLYFDNGIAALIVAMMYGIGLSGRSEAISISGPDRSEASQEPADAVCRRTAMSRGVLQ
jgi:O-Antigen ligase.